MAATLFVGNDNDVYLKGYTLASTGAGVTDALPTFTVSLFDGNDANGNPKPGAAISGLTAINMSYVTGSTGDYRGLIPGTLNLTPDAQYYIVVTFSNYNDQFVGWFTASPRTPGAG
jgi:hypothetical protein